MTDSILSSIPVALLDSQMKLELALVLSAFGLLAILFWLFPPAVWFAKPSFRCPRCESKDVCPSMPASIRDQIHLLLERHPYRCRACWYRFSVKGLAARPNLTS
jgi:hypothetical protein